MLTFERVLTVFKDYLAEDERYEILTTSRGYAVMEWDSTRQDWADARACHTPDQMKDILLEAYEGYLEYKTTLCSKPLADSERRKIQEQLKEMSDLLQ